MRYEKEKCERLILESTLFSLNKEEQYSAYKRELYRMIENLYCYLMSINESAYEPPYMSHIINPAARQPKIKTQNNHKNHSSSRKLS